MQFGHPEVRIPAGGDIVIPSPASVQLRSAATIVSKGYPDLRHGLSKGSQTIGGMIPGDLRVRGDDDTVIRAVDCMGKEWAKETSSVAGKVARQGCETPVMYRRFKTRPLIQDVNDPHHVMSGALSWHLRKEHRSSAARSQAGSKGLAKAGSKGVTNSSLPVRVAGKDVPPVDEQLKVESAAIQSEWQGMVEDAKGSEDEEEVEVEKAICDNNDWCRVCKSGGDLLLCDGRGCRKSFHGDCCYPPLAEDHSGRFYCIDCERFHPEWRQSLSDSRKANRGFQRGSEGSPTYG